MSDAASTLQAEANAFLQLDSEARLAALRRLGLGRYGPFFAHMRASEANIACLLRFIGNPDRVKFPDLRGVELSGLALGAVNGIRGDFSGADLRGCDLSGADLLFARFNDARLDGARLEGATLSRTVWDGASVVGCCFFRASGLSEGQKCDLAARGALFA